MTIPKIVIKADDETEIRQLLRQHGIDALKKKAGYIPKKTSATWDNTQYLINRLPTDHILAVSYEDSRFIQELIFSENFGTLTALIDKDRL